MPNNNNNKNKNNKNNRPPQRGGRGPGAANASNMRAGRRRTRPNRPAGNVVSTNTFAGKRTPTTTMLNGSTIVSHSETYGINVTGSSDFEVFSNWALQPGISSYSRGSPLGSWLPQIAGNFDNYEIQSLKFSYRAACSTLEPGLIVFGFEPNPEGSNPTTYQELRNMLSIDGSVHANATFDVSSKVRKALLTRKGGVINLPSYDAGRVFFGTIGCTEGAKLGFIDVHYRVRLFNPQSEKSTTIPNVTYLPMVPTYRVSYTTTSDAVISPHNNCFQFMAQMVSAGTVTGASNMFTSGSSAPTLDTTIQGGCVYKQTTAQTGWRGLTAAHSGRYRVRAGIAADFKDMKLYCLVPFKRTGGGEVVVASSNVYSSVAGNSFASLDCLSTVHRGFTGPASGDPDPGTDMGLYATWSVDLAAGETLFLLLGIRSYNGVSATSAEVTFRAGLGPSYIEADFLGPPNE
nr:structural protein [Tolivirales sp.]